jgi:hypothetical protein
LATPVQWSGNGHWYEAVHVAEGVYWSAASAAAEAEGGHLATATSAEENAFIFGLAADAQFWFLGAPSSEYSFGPWLGGVLDTGGWTWVTGEAWDFTNWALDEPNNSGGNEDRVQFFTNHNVGSLTPGPTWNDAPGALPMLGYVIEWPGLPTGIEEWPESGLSWTESTWGRVKCLYE